MSIAEIANVDRTERQPTLNARAALQRFVLRRIEGLLVPDLHIVSDCVLTRESTHMDELERRPNLATKEKS
jgi:hypothetical protein